MCHLWQVWQMRRGVTGLAEAQMSFAEGSLLTVAEVAAIMRVSNMTVYRLIRSGDLPAIRVGKNYRIREAAAQRYLSDRSVHVRED
jgi:excisionase family DNA binding protein